MVPSRMGTATLVSIFSEWDAGTLSLLRFPGALLALQGFQNGAWRHRQPVHADANRLRDGVGQSRYWALVYCDGFRFSNTFSAGFVIVLNSGVRVERWHICISTQMNTIRKHGFLNVKEVLDVAPGGALVFALSGL